MSKTVTIRTDHEYTSKGGTITVEEALAWCEKHETRETEEGEEEPKYSPGDLICYAVNRLKALSKDNKRYKKGELASRLYAPRIDNVEEKPRGLTPAVEEIHELGERLAPKEKKAPAPRKPKARKPAQKRARKPKEPAKAAVEAASPNPELGAVL